MRKAALFMLMAISLAACGNDPVATIISEDVVTTQPDGSKVTTSPTPTPKAKPIKVSPGAVVTCRDVQFIAKPDVDVIINCLDGAQGFNIAAIKGPAIINVWGTWCGPCRQELPIFVQYFDKKDPAIQLVGIDVEDAPYLQVQPFVIAQGMKYPNFYDPDRSTRTYFGMSVPVTWFIDANNKVAHKYYGAMGSLNELQSLAQRYLGVA